MKTPKVKVAETDDAVMVRSFAEQATFIPSGNREHPWNLRQPNSIVPLARLVVIAHCDRVGAGPRSLNVQTRCQSASIAPQPATVRTKQFHPRSEPSAPGEFCNL